MEERITERDFYPVIDECVDCKYYGEFNDCTRPEGSCDAYRPFIEAYTKLRKLENELEDGTIVRLPCKVDDTFYSINMQRKAIVEHQVSEISTNGTTWGVYDYNGSWHLMSEIVFSKEEAEKKLEELSK